MKTVDKITDLIPKIEEVILAYNKDSAEAQEVVSMKDMGAEKKHAIFLMAKHYLSNADERDYNKIMMDTLIAQIRRRKIIPVAYIKRNIYQIVFLVGKQILSDYCYFTDIQKIIFSTIEYNLEQKKPKINVDILIKLNFDLGLLAFGKIDKSIKKQRQIIPKLYKEKECLKTMQSYREKMSLAEAIKEQRMYHEQLFEERDRPITSYFPDACDIPPEKMPEILMPTVKKPKRQQQLQRNN